MFVAFPSKSPAQVRVLISGGFSAPYQELLPQFEKSTGITVTTAIHCFAMCNANFAATLLGIGHRNWAAVAKASSGVP